MLPPIEHVLIQILTDLFSPVFNIEILDTTELAGIVGHAREFQRTGVRRDEDIVRTDHRSMHFDRSANLGIVKCRCVGKSKTSTYRKYSSRAAPKAFHIDAFDHRVDHSLPRASGEMMLIQLPRIR